MNFGVLIFWLKPLSAAFVHGLKAVAIEDQHLTSYRGDVLLSADIKNTKKGGQIAIRCPDCHGLQAVDVVYLDMALAKTAEKEFKPMLLLCL